MWKSDSWRLYHIGDFFTDLALEIFGGEKTAGSQDSGDIDCWDLDAQIEVKGCGNHNTPKIYYEQLESEIAQMGFPFNNLWYVIFFYRNRWRDKSRSLSKETPTRKALDAFLSENTMAAFAIDAKVLVAIRKINGLKAEQRTNGVFHTIKINKTTFQRFVENPKCTLQHLNLRGFGVLNQKIRMQFRGSMVDFNLSLILPKKQLAQVFQQNLNFSEAEEEESPL